jgi:XcyI restriction endonuclease
MNGNRFRPPDPNRQLDSHQLLLGFRQTILLGAVEEAVRQVDRNQLAAELSQYAPAVALARLDASGIRPEHVFPTPALLTVSPALLGYYRLLLGSPQKSFYAGGTGLGRFKIMEVRGVLGRGLSEMLPELCQSLSEQLGKLVVDSSPPLTLQDLRELPLLTLGSQIQGSRNNKIGQQATEQVFLSIRSLIPDECVVSQAAKSLRIKNASGREVKITLGSDPDVSVEELVGTVWHRKVALEIKGGGDHSNAHNRVGEAEKSHQKARGKGFTEFWTVISSIGLDLSALGRESPTTTEWFELTEVLIREGDQWLRFRGRIILALGIPDLRLGAGE